MRKMLFISILLLSKILLFGQDIICLTTDEYLAKIECENFDCQPLPISYTNICDIYIHDKICLILYHDSIVIKSFTTNKREKKVIFHQIPHVPFLTYFDKVGSRLRIISSVYVPENINCKFDTAYVLGEVNLETMEFDSIVSKFSNCYTHIVEFSNCIEKYGMDENQWIIKIGKYNLTTGTKAIFDSVKVNTIDRHSPVFDYRQISFNDDTIRYSYIIDNSVMLVAYSIKSNTFSRIKITDISLYPDQIKWNQSKLFLLYSGNNEIDVIDISTNQKEKSFPLKIKEKGWNICDMRISR